MGAQIRDETLKFNAIINGSQAQKELGKFEQKQKDITKANEKLLKTKIKLEKQNKQETDEYKKLNKEIDKNTKELDQNEDQMKKLRREIGLTGLSANQLRKMAGRLRGQLNNTVKAANPKKYAQLKKELAAVNKQMNKVAVSSKKGGKAMALLKSLIPAALFATLIAGAARLIKELFNLSRQIQGENIRSAVVFGDQLGYVEEQAGKLAKKMGVTNHEFVAMAAGTADLLIPLDFTRQQAAEMSTELQALTGAMDEWTSGSIGAKEISNILTKAMLGENEQLKQLGIAIRKDTDEFRDLVKQKLATTDATKVQAEAMATLELIQKKSADAQEAYTREGNKLLRFQKEAGRRWRQMKENVVEYFDVPIEKSLLKQQQRVNALSLELTDLNTNEKKRNEILNELKRINPDIVEGIDAQNINMKKLNENLEKYNENIVKTIILEGFRKEKEEEARKVAEAITALERKKIELSAKMVEIDKEILDTQDTQENRLKRIKEILKKRIEQEDIVNTRAKAASGIAGMNVEMETRSKNQKEDILEIEKEISELTKNKLEAQQKFGDLSGEIKQLQEILNLNQEIIGGDDGSGGGLKEELSITKALKKLRDELGISTKQYAEYLRSINQELELEVIGLEDEADAEDSPELKRAMADQKYARELYMQTDQFKRELLAKQLEDGIIGNQQYYDEIARMDAENQVQKANQYAAFASEMGNILQTATSDQENGLKEATKRFTFLMLDLLKDQTQIAMTGVTIQSLASPESIATFGVAGLAKAAIIIGLIEAAFGAVKGVVSQADTGIYDVIGANDGKAYNNVPYQRKLRTGLVHKPILVGERPEIVIDPETTQRLFAQFPQAIQMINMARVPQFAAGDYSNVPVTNNINLDNSDLKAELNANRQTMVMLVEAIQNGIYAIVPDSTSRDIGTKIDEAKAIENFT